ncbi:hypothetical protein FOZ60_005486 [Perkinsus olseni]|uniref:Uncharacterized protein n=1 Tax=Perkinsus olseni TaxID=32597 RepID=A0A7J6PG33_PEROL|nr:hypothetical protein FOZ60_005486 [Perkinsus olseni]
MIYACALLFATACAGLDAGPLGGYVPNGQVEGDYPIRIFDFESQMYVKLADRDFQPHLGTSFLKGTTLEIKLSDESLGALEKKYPKKINSTTFTTVKVDGKKNIITITYADGNLACLSRPGLVTCGFTDAKLETKAWLPSLVKILLTVL